MEDSTNLVGRTIVAIRPLTENELELNGGWSRALGIELNDGTIISASRDPEGNGPGVFFGITKDEECFLVTT